MHTETPLQCHFPIHIACVASNHHRRHIFITHTMCNQHGNSGRGQNGALVHTWSYRFRGGVHIGPGEGTRRRENTPFLRLPCQSNGPVGTLATGRRGFGVLCVAKNSLLWRFPDTHTMCTSTRTGVSWAKQGSCAYEIGETGVSWAKQGFCAYEMARTGSS